MPCWRRAFVPSAPSITGIFPRLSRTAAAGRIATWPATMPTLPSILAKNLGDRITVWAPFNMPEDFTYRGLWNRRGSPPFKANIDLFLKAAHTVNLAQGMAFRAIKAASSKATVGSAYGMEPVYPKTNSEADRAAAARFHAAQSLLHRAGLSWRLSQGFHRRDSL